MSLLNHLVEHSLDDGYAEAAAGRRTASVTAQRGRARPVLLAGLVAVGLLLSTAAVEAHDRASSTVRARTALTAQIERRDAANDRLERSLGRDRAQVDAARRAALRMTAAGKRLATALAPLELVTGARPVRGPALVVQVADAPDDASDADADPRTDQPQDGRVTDRDLQTIVNEVWAAGAEAVGVNGQRLTAGSAIRSAGDAVLVDFRPLSPPYDVVAIGDAEALRASFLDGFGGSYLQALRDYGVTYSVSTRATTRLSASAGVALRYAGPTARPNGSST